MTIDHDSHVSAIAIYNNAAMRTVGGSSEGDAQQPTEFGLILIGAGVPIELREIEGPFLAGDYDTDPGSLKSRFRAARFLRDLADRIEAKNLLESEGAK